MAAHHRCLAQSWSLPSNSKDYLMTLAVTQVLLWLPLLLNLRPPCRLLDLEGVQHAMQQLEHLMPGRDPRRTLIAYCEQFTCTW